MTKRSRLASGRASNRTVFYAIIALAVSIIVCGVLTQSFGWNRVCGSGVLVVGAVLFLLADDKKWPAVILLAGLALFFGDSLLALLPAGPK
jgi:Flp pilus assembly protein protease CpaA